MIYLVTYELSDWDRGYAAFDARLRTCGEVLPFQKTASLLSSDLSNREIRDVVRETILPPDSFLIVDITRTRWAGLNTRLSAWIEERRGDA